MSKKLIVAQGCINLRQGDIVQVPRLKCHNDVGETEPFDTPDGVAILSQSCDVVQTSKQRLIVAPVVAADKAKLSAARKGQSPLALFLSDSEATPKECVVDLEFATSVPKAFLEGKLVLARYVPEESGDQAKAVADRIGRAFSRFPFPDEVYPFFRKFRSRVQNRVGTASNFGKVIDLVDEIRVQADQWRDSHRELKMFFIVSGKILVSQEDLELNGEPNPNQIQGLGSGEKIGQELSLDRICELILANPTSNPKLRAELWYHFGKKVEKELFVTNGEVEDLEIEVLNDVEMTYRDFVNSASLDLEVLSDSVSTKSK